jgi:hypothetical protein
MDNKQINRCKKHKSNLQNIKPRSAA